MIELRKGDFLVTQVDDQPHTLLGIFAIERQADYLCSDSVLLHIPPAPSRGMLYDDPKRQTDSTVQVVAVSPFYTSHYYRGGTLVEAHRVEGIPATWRVVLPENTTPNQLRTTLIGAGILRDPLKPHDLVDVLVERGGSRGFDHFAFIDMLSALNVEDQASARRMIMYMAGMVR